MTRALIISDRFGATLMKQHKHSPLKRWTFWLNRMLLKRLLSLSDAVLNDMGLTREDVIWACELPLCRDAAVHMRKRADARRNAHRREPVK